MKPIVLVAMFLICSNAFAITSPSQIMNVIPLSAQSYSEQATNLINQLVAVKEKRGLNEIFIIAPDRKVQEQIRSQLLEMANKSRESRNAVIQALIKVLDDKLAKEEALLSKRWILSVEILGELQAVEAIDILIKNLGESGAIVNIIPYVPPARVALLKIGKPAIPQLIKALVYKDLIRQEVIDVLVRINKDAIPELIDALSNSNPSIRGGAAIALGMIGGQQAKDAINRALEKEGNRRAKKQFKYALEYIRKYHEAQ